MHDLPLHSALVGKAPRELARSAATFDLAVPRDRRRTLALSWLVLGLAALAASGIFALLLVVSRTPGLGALIRVADFFRVTLVVHVDLSVLVWFLAFAAMLWSLAGGTRALGVGIAAIAVAAVGAATMAAAPFVEDARPVMSNYVPVLDGPVFLAGLALFALGVTLACPRGMWVYEPVGARVSGA